MGTNVLYFITLLKVLGFLAAVFIGGAVLVCGAHVSDERPRFSKNRPFMG